MLHEVMLALNGCTGSVLFKTNRVLDWSKIIHPSERALLKRILLIGETYGYIQLFIDKNIYHIVQFDPADTNNDEDNNTLELGMYLQAFCDGLQKVIQPYKSDIVALEKAALRDPYLSLTTINNHISVYSQLLCSLKSVISEIEANRIHGCKILQYVHRHLCTGVESMREAFSVITSSCHTVLINQLVHWLIYGQLMDQYKEFFIKSSEAGSSLRGALVGNADHENMIDDTTISSASVQLQNDDYEFILVEDFLPPYISYVTANKILYIGRTVILFKTDLQKGKFDSPSCREAYHPEDIKMIKSLHNSLFQDDKFLESVINKLETSVTQRLWRLAMEEADLMKQLKAIKDFYLLGRGEMFVDFLNKVGSILNKQICANASRELNLALVASARNVQYSDESTLEKFQFKLPQKDSCGQGVRVKSVLRLEYSVTLPLHLFFSPVVIDNYNILFRFFLRVKQAQLNLHGIWMKDVKNKTQLLTDRGWQLRNHLMFLVENLQCYLQWDVVESEHTALLTELKKTEDFEKIRHLHHRFLFNVLSQAFLIPNDTKFDQNTGLLLASMLSQNVKPHPANIFLGHILELSEAFCLLVTRSDNKNIYDELETMSEKLSHCVKVLVKLITNLRNQISGVHLTKLLLRLDYNHYFSRSYDVTAAPV